MQWRGHGDRDVCRQSNTSTQAIEIDPDSCECYLHNFKHSFLVNADLRDVNTVAKADVALLTLDCSEHSSLGDGNQGYFDNVVLGTYKILKAASPRVIFSENVPGFYDSRTFHDLTELLSTDYGYKVGPIHFDSYDFGSIVHRPRSYMLFMKEREDFELFREPKPPKFRRLKLKEYLDKGNVQHTWKSVAKWQESFAKKVENKNSWAYRSTAKTFGATNGRPALPKP